MEDAATSARSKARAKPARPRLRSFLIATIALAIVLQTIDHLWLRTAVTPRGILSVQLAGTAAAANAVLAALQPLVALKVHLWLDYLFMLAYGGLIVLAGRALAEGLTDARRLRLAALAWLTVAVGLVGVVADAVENLTWLWIAGGGPTARLAPVGYIAAIVKFVIIGVTAARLSALWLLLVFGRASADSKYGGPSSA